VITVDIEASFLHGVITNDIYMEIGQCIDVLIYQYSDIYVEKVFNSKLYVKLNQAFYCTIEAAKLVIVLPYKIGFQS